MRNSFTPDEVTNIENEAYNAGRISGFYECHDVAYEAIGELRKSLEDVWSIECENVYPKKNSPTEDRLLFAINTLVHLEEVFQDRYDMGLEILKSEASVPLVRDGMTQEQFFRHLDDVDNK